MHLSARAYHRILKLAPTTADPDNSGDIQNTHLAEALQYRPANFNLRKSRADIHLHLYRVCLTYGIKPIF